MPLIHPIGRKAFSARELVTEFPPRISDRNKRIAFGIACPPGSVYSGTIEFSRWTGTSLPAVFEPERTPAAFEAREDYFGYEPPPEGAAIVEWYLNFAHYDLFLAYGGPLFAQDEMQVVEHPALASLREALLDSELPPLSVEDGEPTPALIRGVERRCRVATDPNPALDRPYGLYGNHFARASPEAIRKATEALDPPTISNILAMEAPAGGLGRYSLDEIEYIVRTAFIGFAAARLESGGETEGAPEVVVHTGFWGCGAYGGNRTLMVMLQLLAARLAGLDRLVFHTGDAAGSEAYARGLRIWARIAGDGAKPRDLSGVLEEIEGLGFEWGVSDGN